MKTGIIIPFYNGHQYLSRLIESFDRAAKNLQCTLFIIDNSPGNTSIDISWHADLKIEIIREEPGIGYGKACNHGYQICKERGYDYIIIANQDGYVSEKLISELLLPFQQDDKMLITAPLLRIYDSRLIEDFFVKYYISQVPEVISDLIDGNARNYYEVSQISGACFAFSLKNKLYSYPYFFDPLFHMYSEDEDLCQRVMEVNGKIGLVFQDAAFYHKHSYTTDNDNKEAIEAGSLVSDKIFRLKDISKGSVNILYRIFATTVSTFILHILRGKIKKAYMELRSFIIVLFKFPAIIKARRRDMIYGPKAVNTGTEKFQLEKGVGN